MGDKPIAVRKWIHESIEISKGQLAISQFSKAQKFIQHENGKTFIKISFWDKASYYFSLIFSIFLFVLPVIVVLFAIAYKVGFSLILFTILFALVSFFMGYIFINDAISFETARTINSVLVGPQTDA